MLQSSWGRWTLFVLGWTGLSLLFVPEAYLFFLYREEAIPISRIVALTLANAGIVLLFLPGIIWLSRRFPLEQKTWGKALLVHIPACLLFSLSHSWLYAALCYASPKLFHMLFIRFHPNLLTYWAVVGFSSANDYFRRYKEREKQLAQAELHLLRAQLQPHFLFNCLHTISAMVHEDAAAADRMISRLSELLRVVLQSIGKHEISLQEELELVQAYVEIERVRFHERLTLDLQVDPNALDAFVPSMMLQPLAENSIHHGFRSGQTAGRITIEAAKRDGHLTLTFSDNGCGFDKLSPSSHNGLGLRNTRKRLEQLYKDNYRFELQGASGGGTCWLIEIPYHIGDGSKFSEVVELVNDDSSVDRRRRGMGAKAHR
jgi:two-component system, LytTR family, sensor kinase